MTSTAAGLKRSNDTHIGLTLLQSEDAAQDGQARRVGASLSQEGPEGMGAANSAEDGALKGFACCKRDEQSSRYLVSHPPSCTSPPVRGMIVTSRPPDFGRPAMSSAVELYESIRCSPNHQR